MSFRLLKRNKPVSSDEYVNFASNLVYGDKQSAIEAAQALVAEFTWSVIVVEEVAEVALLPTVRLLRTEPVPLSGIQHNLGPDNGEPSGLPAATIPHYTKPEREVPLTPDGVDQLNKQIEELAKKEPPREPQVRPRLLIIPSGEPTQEQLGQYQMIVGPAGRVFKNAFGALEVDDLPLRSEERLELKNALHL